jgi:hypothetical protein
VCDPPASLSLQDGAPDSGNEDSHRLGQPDIPLSAGNALEAAAAEERPNTSGEKAQALEYRDIKPRPARGGHAFASPLGARVNLGPMAGT